MQNFIVMVKSNGARAPSKVDLESLEKLFASGVLIGYFSGLGFYQNTEEHKRAFLECGDKKRILVTIGSDTGSIFEGSDFAHVDIETFFGLVGVIRYSLPMTLNSFDDCNLRQIVHNCAYYIEIIRSGSIIPRCPIEITPIGLYEKMLKKRNELETVLIPVKNILKSISNDSNHREGDGAPEGAGVPEGATNGGASVMSDVYLSLEYLEKNAREDISTIMKILEEESFYAHEDIVVKLNPKAAETFNSLCQFSQREADLESLIEIVKTSKPMTSINAQLKQIMKSLNFSHNEASNALNFAWCRFLNIY
jgi:hypothetical protein